MSPMTTSLDCFEDLAVSPELPTATEAKEHCLYVIRHLPTDLTKIGITAHLARRCTQLDVGVSCRLITARQTQLNDKHEAILLDHFKSNRLPGSEWLALNDWEQKLLEKRVSLVGPPASLLEQIQLMREPAPPSSSSAACSLAEKHRIWSEGAKKANDSQLELLTHASASLFEALVLERTDSMTVDDGKYIGMAPKEWDDFMKALLSCSTSLANAYSSLAAEAI